MPQKPNNLLAENIKIRHLKHKLLFKIIKRILNAKNFVVLFLCINHELTVELV